MMRTHIYILLLVCTNILGVPHYNGMQIPDNIIADLASSELYADPCVYEIQNSLPYGHLAQKTPDDFAQQRFHHGIRVRQSPWPTKPQPIPKQHEWAIRFQDWNERDILSQYHLYQYASFREYIQELPGFEDVIYDFYDTICHKLRKNIFSRTKYEWFTLGDSLKNAREYVGALVAQANERKAERRKQHEEARKQEHELQRQREEQKRAEEQKRQCEINTYGATLDDCINAWSAPTSDILRDVYHSRVEAARHLQNDDRTSDYEYTVTPQAAELLHDLGLDVGEFQTLHGNVLQHTLHDEFVSMVDTLVPQYQSYRHIDEIADLHHLAIKASDIGRQYNASGDISNASYIADACWHIVYGLQEVTIGASEGVVQGVGNTGHMIAHPVATVQNIGYGVAWLINGVITNTTDACTLLFGDDESANVAWDSLCGRVRHVKNVLEYLRDNASIRNVSREATSLIVEGYLQHKMISTLADFYNNANRYATNFAEYASFYEEEALLQTAEGVYVEIADEAAIESTKINNEAYLLQEGKKYNCTTLNNVVNQTNQAILKNGYYEVNGFRFTEYYYFRLWKTGREAPSLIAQAILDDVKEIIPDPKGHQGFFKYLSNDWEMIYNPQTKIVSHIQPVK